MGDRSQITAVALGASNEVWGVIIGGSFVSLLSPIISLLSIGARAVFIVWSLVRSYIHE